MFEQIFFIIASIILFGCIFYKIIRKNDTSYVIIIAIEALGIAIDVFFLLSNSNMNMIIKILTYAMSIILPLVIIYLERKDINIMQNLKMLKVNFYLLRRDTKKAKDALINMIEKDEQNYDAHKKLAQIYEKEGGIRKSIDEYVQCIDINKQDYDSYYKVSNLLIELDRKDEAIQMLNNLLSKKPDYENATIDLGDLLIEKQRYKEAVGIYLDALKNNPLSYDLNYNLGIVYTMLNDFKSAKEYYEKAAEINSIEYNPKYYLGELALLYKELEKAEEYFNQVIDDEELGADAYFELAKINIIKGHKDIAIRYANIAIDLNSKKISDKIKNEPLFMTIRAKISIPFKLEEKEESNKLSDKEKKAKEHLEKTGELTAFMGYSKEKKLYEKENEKEDNLRETQE